MSKFAPWLLLMALSSSTMAGAQDPGDGDRFVIPPEAMSPLRRPNGSEPRVARPAPASVVPEILRDESALPAPVRATRMPFSRRHAPVPSRSCARSWEAATTRRNWRSTRWTPIRSAS